MTDVQTLFTAMRAIGSDRFVSRDEVQDDSIGEWLDFAWQVYADHFDRFTGASLDPLFCRLDHPARRFGAPQFRDEAVLIVGTGPSLPAALPMLSRLRDCLRIITSPRGAEMLRPHGIAPDLVLIVHRSALDAEIALRQFRRLDARPAFERAAWVGAEAKTPVGLLKGVAPDRLFIPDGLLSWGVWPADAVAMALGSGAARIGLLGVDFGSPSGLDPVFRSWAALLSLLTRIGGASFEDCSEAGAPKVGWRPTSIANFASAATLAPLTVTYQPRPPLERRASGEMAVLDRVEPLLRHAREALHDGLEARASAQRLRKDLEPRLICACERMMSWKEDAAARGLLQEGLGVSFLPRLWRWGVPTRDAASLWRTVILASHEIVAQAERLRDRAESALSGARSYVA